MNQNIFSMQTFAEYSEAFYDGYHTKLEEINGIRSQGKCADMYKKKGDIWLDINDHLPEIAAPVFCLINDKCHALGFRAHSGWYILTTQGKKYIHHGYDKELGIKITAWKEGVFLEL